MPLPHLYLYHPPESLPANAYLVEWLGEVQGLLLSDVNWDGCQWRRVPYDSQAGFNIATEVQRVRDNPGPVIFIQKVQARLFNRFREIMSRTVSVYSINPASSEEIYAACEQARLAFEDGEPRISLRELISYLIIAKLARQDKWGGTALNKNFLWKSDLPKGGFPKDLCSDREILEAVNVLWNEGLLTAKKSEGERKYALGAKNIIQPILDSKSFPGEMRSLRNYFDRSSRQAPARLLSYNED